MSENTARSVWFPGPQRVDIRSEALGAVGPKDIRVEALASGISQGTEMLVYRGQVAAGTSLDLPTLRGSFSFPVKYGYASVGTVAEIGDAVHDLHVGDQVFVHHPHQTRYVVPAANAIALPSDLDPVLGTFMANLETAINVILDAQPRLGDRVVIFGQGVVGLLITQLLSRMAVEIITIDPLPQRRELSVTCGAGEALAPIEGLDKRVEALTHGVGADLTIEVSGNPAALAKALECAGPESRVVVCSWYGDKEATLPLGRNFHRGRLAIISSQVGCIDPCLAPRWDTRRRLELARDLLRELKLSVLVSHTFPFEDVTKAYEMLDQRPEGVAQVVLTYEAEHV